MSVTIKDIAKELGISHTTVSRALNNSTLIREETKKKVKETAQAMGYSPNYSARALVNARSYNIGLFFSSIMHGTSPDFFHGIIQSVSKEVGHKYNLMVHGIDLFYRELQQHHFDGIILVSQSEQDQGFIESALEKEIPIVVINRIITGAEVTNIVSDDEMGVQQGVEYLMSKGHLEIGIIEGKEGFQSSIERKNGYLNALKSHQITCRPQWCVQGDYSMMSGYTGMGIMLEQHPIPTAVFCANDDMAFGALKMLSEKGIHVPEEMSLLGFDGSLFATYSAPELSTIRKPIDEMSQIAVRELKKIIQGQKGGYLIYKKTELIIGETICTKARLRK